MISSQKFHVRSYGIALALFFGAAGIAMTCAGLAGYTAVDIHATGVSGHIQTALAGLVAMFFSTIIAVASILKPRCANGSIEVRTSSGTHLKLGGVGHQREIFDNIPRILREIEERSNGGSIGGAVHASAKSARGRVQLVAGLDVTSPQ